MYLIKMVQVRWLAIKSHTWAQLNQDLIQCLIKSSPQIGYRLLFCKYNNYIIHNTNMYIYIYLYLTRRFRVSKIIYLFDVLLLLCL